MPSPTDKQPSPERAQTDESLRIERERVDDALADQLSLVEETADAVISKARARADEVVAAARAKVDQHSPSRKSNQRSPGILERERAVEDSAVREERATADETLRAERAEHVALASSEREETDRDLSGERAKSDDAVATRDEFLGVVGHDLRNLLSAMVGSAALIAEAVSQENHLEHVLTQARRIQRAGSRMNRLIGDLVDVAIIEAGMLAVTREHSDPAHVVAEAVETFQTHASVSGVSLVADICLPSSLVPFDPARVLQVLTNLLSNAIKFTPAGGKVLLRVERIEDELCFSVSDTGQGIPADKLEAVFQRFRQINTGDRRGVGLGLYISKCIVQGHGGRIWAESSVGKGSTFRFTLPIEARGLGGPHVAG
jgi:signal transduction histidine kinase